VDLGAAVGAVSAPEAAGAAVVAGADSAAGSEVGVAATPPQAMIDATQIKAAINAGPWDFLNHLNVMVVPPTFEYGDQLPCIRITEIDRGNF
jgi:hypothetical protein